MRRVLIIAAIIVALGSMPFVIGAWFVTEVARETNEALGGRGEAINPELSHAYVHEDGGIAYRPNSLGQTITINTLTLGQAVGSAELHGSVIDEADPGSFRVLSSDFAVDRNNAYFEWKPIPGADPSSFAVLTHGYSHDNATIWQEDTAVMTGTDLSEASVAAFDAKIFRIDDQAYFRADEVLALPEFPQTPITSHCRDWFEMNDALWFASARITSLDGPIDVLECDGSIRRTLGEEDLETNNGLVFVQGQSVIWARITGSNELLYAADDTIAAAHHLAPRYDEDFVLLELASGDHWLVEVAEEESVHFLGNHPGQSYAPNDVSDRLLMIGDRLFVYDEDAAGGVPFAAAGQARRVGDYFLAETAVYYRASKIMGANPDTIQLHNGAVASDRGYCYFTFRYVGDIDPDKAQDGDSIAAHCRDMGNGDLLYYEGLGIRFAPNASFQPEQSSDEAERDPEFPYRYRLGDVALVNPTDESLTVSAELLDSITVWARGAGPWQKVEADRPEIERTGNGYTIEPNGEVSWPVYIQSDVDDLHVQFRMSLDHSPEKQDRLEEQTFMFQYGHLSARTRP